MVALVLVAHSRGLALALRETLRALYTDRTPPIAVAAGTGDDGELLGTDATAIMAAVEEVGAEAEGVLVLLDLGSAVLSAELALELLDDALRAKTVLCPAPLVEGAIAAAAQCGLGAPLADVRAEAENALRQKLEHLGGPPSIASSPSIASISSTDVPTSTATFDVRNASGLHARPAMRIVQAVSPFASSVEIENLRTGRPAASARSLVSISCLDAQRGDTIRVTARGHDATQVIHALELLHAENFGDALDGGKPPVTETPPVLMEITPLPSDGASTRGAPLCEGIALGKLFFVPNAALSLPPPPPNVQPAAELVRLRNALAAVRRELGESACALSARLGSEHGAILQAHQMLASDPSLIRRAESLVEETGLPATHAWEAASREAADRYRHLEQPLLRERARDVEDLAQRVLRELGVPATLRFDLPGDGYIVAVPTLLPSEVAALDSRKVCGVIAEAIGPTSHAAILLRAAGVPTVDATNLQRLREAAGDGEITAALDGGTGEIWLRPGDAQLHELEGRRRRFEADAAPASAGGAPPAPLQTRDGRRVELAANAASVAEATAAVRAGAEGIGLLRTEFLFFDRLEPPTEDEQTEALRSIAAVLPAGAPVTVRTFDIGGDKPVSFLPVPPEENPFLGVRGIRLALRNREMFLTHLRAILRAAHGGRMRVMFPMVAEVEEIRAARALLDEAHASLEGAGVPHAWPLETGMMIEVPAAALNVHTFVPEVDFFSVGTNDLTQYTLAAERGHPQLGADFADALHPAVLRLIARVAELAGAGGKWVGVCGEAAADPVAAAVFVGLGVGELSAGAASLPRLRRAVAECTYEQDSERARRCVEESSSGRDVRRRWRAGTGETI